MNEDEEGRGILEIVKEDDNESEVDEEEVRGRPRRNLRKPAMKAPKIKPKATELKQKKKVAEEKPLPK